MRGRRGDGRPGHRSPLRARRSVLRRNSGAGAAAHERAVRQSDLSWRLHALQPGPRARLRGARLAAGGPRARGGRGAGGTAGKTPAAAQGAREGGAAPGAALAGRGGMDGRCGPAPVGADAGRLGRRICGAGRRNCLRRARLRGPRPRARSNGSPAPCSRCSACRPSGSAFVSSTQTARPRSPPVSRTSTVSPRFTFSAPACRAA